MTIDPIVTDAQVDKADALKDQILRLVSSEKDALVALTAVTEAFGVTCGIVALAEKRDPLEIHKLCSGHAKALALINYLKVSAASTRVDPDSLADAIARTKAGEHPFDVAKDIKLRPELTREGREAAARAKHPSAARH